ncbi:MAG: hypothetical protein IJQ25_01105 [Oscillibacter sp.]|nr:hypothetical protein [Oscillibacter sp.]
MEIDNFSKEAYNRALSEASKDDDNGISLIDAPYIVCKLDALTKELCKQLRYGQQLSGCDAYLQANGIHWFIEFKNQDAKGVYGKRVDLWKKAYDSICTVRMVLDPEIPLDTLCQNAILLIVYRDEKPEPEHFKLLVEKGGVWGKVQEFIRDGLRPLEGKLYREVHTIPKSVFCDQWIPQIWGFQDIQQGV